MTRPEVLERLDSWLDALGRVGIRNAAFPVNPETICRRLKNCRLITYQEIAKENGTSVADIADLFGSQDGCTHYEWKHDRFLISYNTAKFPSRIRWTIAHELGHVAAGHFYELEDRQILSAPPELHEMMEDEADYFASELLAPTTAIITLGVRSASDLRIRFGLSDDAAGRRWAEFRKTGTGSKITPFRRGGGFYKMDITV